MTNFKHVGINPNDGNRMFSPQCSTWTLYIPSCLGVLENIPSYNNFQPVKRFGQGMATVPNGAGARQGPGDGLPRARDWTGEQKICRPRPQNLKTAVFSQGDGTLIRDTNRQRVPEDCGLVVGIVVNGGGRHGTTGTAGDAMGRRGILGDSRVQLGTVGDCKRRQVMVGNRSLYEEMLGMADDGRGY